MYPRNLRVQNTKKMSKLQNKQKDTANNQVQHVSVLYHQPETPVAERRKQEDIPILSTGSQKKLSDIHIESKTTLKKKIE